MFKLVYSIVLVLICQNAFAQGALYFLRPNAGGTIRVLKNDLAPAVDKPLFEYAGTQEYFHNTTGRPTTSDLEHRIFYVVSSYLAVPDTLVVVDLKHTTVNKFAIPRDHMYAPEYFEEKIYGMSAYGVTCFDLKTNQVSIYGATVKEMNPKTIRKAAVNFRDHLYLYEKVSNSLVPTELDTLYAYDLLKPGQAEALRYLPIPDLTLNFDYSTDSNKLLVVGGTNYIQPATNGWRSYTFDMTNNKAQLKGNPRSGPAMSNFGTYDPDNDRLYTMMATNVALDSFNHVYMFDNRNNKTWEYTTKGQAVEYLRMSFLTNNVKDQQDDAVQVKFYPNPATNLLHVAGIEGTYTVIDVKGSIVLQGTLQRGKAIDISRLVPAKYLLRINNPVQEYTGIFIKE